MSQSPPPSPDGPRAAATAVPWLLASAVASVIFGIVSLLLFGASFAGILRGVSFAPSFACGVIGVVLGHLARARRAAPGNSDTVLATAGLVLSYGGTILSLALFALIGLALGLAGPFPPGN
ncbi:MAG TPA: hypothetical protein VF510_07780 [Ktedonobacterales bacterium]